MGKRYAPLFPYFQDHAHAFRVVSDGYVTDDSGTGVVHQAPAFGEDDYRWVGWVGLGGVEVVDGQADCCGMTC